MSTIKQIFSQSTNAREMAPAAVASQVLLMSVVSIGTIVAFNILRPNNKIIYEPKVKYHEDNKKPPRISGGLFGWVSPLIHTKEVEIIEKAGLDAATFLRFLRMFRWCFSALALFCCAVLIPIDVVYNLKTSTPHTVLNMLTIQNVTGSYLYVHVVAVYAVTGIALIFIWIHWGHMVRLRQLWFRSAEYQQAFYARTLLITGVPRKLQSDEGIAEVFRSMSMPYPTTSQHIGRKVGKLPDLIQYHNDTVRQFEQVLVGYLKGGKIGKERPMLRQGGFLGMGGTKRDAIDFYTAKLQRTDAAIEDYRNNKYELGKPENYGFATLAATPYAHIVARMLQGKNPKGTTVTLAPHPKDIIWENINQTSGARQRKRVTGFLLLALACFFNTVPLFAISVLANISTLTGIVGFLKDWQNASSTTFAIVSGVLPPAVSALFGYFLPLIMRWLSQYQGALTHSALDRAVVARYFFFLVISQLIIFTLIGVGFSLAVTIVSDIGHHKSAKEIFEILKTVPSAINSAYINQSSYWLTFFPLRGFLVVFDLAQVINLVLISFKTHIMGRTPRDHREFTQPQEFPYAVYYSNMLFMGTVGVVFAPLAPLVTVAAAVVFWISSWVYKYQLMFVFTSRVETGGRLWNVVINRFLASIIMMQLLMLLTILIQFGFASFTWIATIPPILIVLGTKIVMERKFNSVFKGYIPSPEEIRNAKIHSQKADAKNNKLERRFGHPALHMEVFTPMLHANMMPLLREVYHGRLNNTTGFGSAKVNVEGTKMEAQVLPGGIRIAGVQQTDLEYDPTIWIRQRRDQDWDTRSMASTNALGDGASLYHSKTGFYADGRNSPVPSLPRGVDQYLMAGPMAGLHSHNPSEIELSRLDSSYASQDQLPLLANQAAPMGYPPTPPQPPMPPQQGYAAYGQGADVREAPLHRPTPMSRQSSSWTPPPPPPDDGNMAGRGAHRGW